MISRITALAVTVLLGAPALRAAELTAVQMTLPFFDDTGRPTHKITAQRGTFKGALTILTNVELVYFSATEPGKIIQRLQAAEAIWDNRQETLTGKGSLTVTTDEHRLTGEGFIFALRTSRLNILRAFTLENKEVRLTSDQAIVDFEPGKNVASLRARDVRRCEATGNLVVVVLPTARKKYPCDRALSNTAIYDAALRTIQLPRPTRIFATGVESTVGTFTFDLGDAQKE